jgi:superfamily I DNA/RNA helicase
MDKDVREQILEDSNNVLVSAGAGSGKTSILVKKISKDLKENKYHYKIGAITFTNKAAKEIKARIGSLVKGSFIGTNDSFVENEIIRPFIKDALGNNYTENFEVVYNEHKFETFEEGLKLLLNSKKLGTYRDNKKNFKFQLALKILKNSLAARQYLSARYFKIFIDEYQDCDYDMHELFMYIKNVLKINLFIVGDPNQSIYIWRGAAPELFKGLINNDNDFSKYKLISNYRCCLDIQNYSNLFLDDTRELFKLKEQAVNDVIGVDENSNPLDYIDLEKEVAILVRTNDEAKNLLDFYNSEGYNFIYIPRTPLDNLGTQNTNVYVELAKYSKDNRYSVYDFINELTIQIKPEEISEIEEIINKLKNNDITKEEIEKIIISLFSKLGYSIELKEIDAFAKVILNDEYDNAYNGKDYKHKIMTVHSAKGLEFDQVIIFASDYNLFRGKDLNEHYVATTRGRDKLVVVLNSKKYMQHLIQVINKCNIPSIEKVIKIV